MYLTGLQGEEVQADLFGQALDVGELHDHPDAAGGRASIGHDEIGPAGNIVAPRGGQRPQGGHDLFLGLDLLDFPQDFLGGAHCPPRGVDAHHDGLDGRVVPEGVQLFNRGAGVGDDPLNFHYAHLLLGRQGQMVFAQKFKGNDGHAHEEQDHEDGNETAA